MTPTPQPQLLFPRQSAPANPARVVITGAGIVTALGVGWDVNAAGFRAGRTAFRPVTLFDVSKQRAKTAAEVDLPSALPATKLTLRQAGRLDRASRMLLLAAHEAWQQSGWAPSENLPLVLGTTAGGMSLGEEYFRHALEHPQRRLGQPTRAFHYQSQIQSRMVAEAFGFQGPVVIVTNACASGTSAIGHAWEEIRRGRAERVLAGGYDAINQLVFAGFDSLQALSTTICRPFDAHRDGLALGEGAALLALETLESAKRRNATILGEIVGFGAAIDVHHLTQPHPEGAAALASMSQACESAKVTPGDIDYVNAHGTGTPLNDSSEAAAISRWAGARAATLPVSSTKASVGHLLGGSGAVEAVVSLMTLRGQWLPPEIAFESPDPLCAFPIVRKPADARVNNVLSNSFGFGGVNATLIFRRWA
jgi:3-oxoacyl-[acyl-carrier-protein] synthase II